MQGSAALSSLSDIVALKGAEIELNVLNGQCLNRHLNTIEKVKSNGNSPPKMQE